MPSIMSLMPSERESCRELMSRRDTLVTAVALGRPLPSGELVRKEDPEVQAVLRAFAQAISRKREEERLAKLERNSQRGPNGPRAQGATAKRREAERSGDRKDFDTRKREKAEADREFRAKSRGATGQKPSYKHR